MKYFSIPFGGDPRSHEFGTGDVGKWKEIERTKKSIDFGRWEVHIGVVYRLQQTNHSPRLESQ